MTPDRREELRRCDDATVRTRYDLDRKNYIAAIEAQERLIKHLQSHVVTDNSKTLENALERIKSLESLLARAGDCLLNNAIIYANDGLAIKIIKEIDAILPATEVDKDEQ